MNLEPSALPPIWSDIPEKKNKKLRIIKTGTKSFLPTSIRVAKYVA